MDHKSGALQVTEKILLNFSKDALAEGRIPIVLILPTYDDLVYYRKHQKWVFENLIKLLKKDGVEPLTIGNDMLEIMGERNLNEFFTHTTDHFNDEGNKILADIVYQKIKAKVNYAPTRRALLPESQ